MPPIKKSWPRVRASKNGAGEESWVVDLRPHGKREYYPSREAAEDAARMARMQRERGNILVRVLKKSWPRVRASRNGAGEESWVVDLRPHGKREYYASRREAEAAAHVARMQHERGKVLVSAVLSKRQILDAQVAFSLLKGINVTLTEVVCDYLDRHHSNASFSLVGTPRFNGP